MQSTQTIAPARAFCGTCDGLGLVGDDDPLRYPTPCPMCGGAGGGDPERKGGQVVVRISGVAE